MRLSATAAALLLTLLPLSRAATPPACLLAAVNEQPNPSDVSALCTTLESAMAGNITSMCSGANEAAAISAYEITCKAQGVSVTISVPASAATGGVDGSGASGTSSSAKPSSTKNAGASVGVVESTTVLVSILVGVTYFL